MAQHNVIRELTDKGNVRGTTGQTTIKAQVSLWFHGHKVFIVCRFYSVYLNMPGRKAIKMYGYIIKLCTWTFFVTVLISIC